MIKRHLTGIQCDSCQGRVREYRINAEGKIQCHACYVARRWYPPHKGDWIAGEMDGELVWCRVGGPGVLSSAKAWRAFLFYFQPRR